MKNGISPGFACDGVSANMTKHFILITHPHLVFFVITAHSQKAAGILIFVILEMVSQFLFSLPFFSQYELNE